VSNRKRQQPEQPRVQLPATYCPQFRFNIEGNITTIAFGQGDTFHVAVAVPTDTVVEFCNKYQQVLADVIRRQAKPEEKPE
jgi:hypothetical protein